VTRRTGATARLIVLPLDCLTEVRRPRDSLLLTAAVLLLRRGFTAVVCFSRGGSPLAASGSSSRDASFAELKTCEVSRPAVPSPTRARDCGTKTGPCSSPVPSGAAPAEPLEAPRQAMMLRTCKSFILSHRVLARGCASFGERIAFAAGSHPVIFARSRCPKSF
jgi:hypothetical protein